MQLLNPPLDWESIPPDLTEPKTLITGVVRYPCQILLNDVGNGYIETRRVNGQWEWRMTQPALFPEAL